jgi:lysozyme
MNMSRHRTPNHKPAAQRSLALVWLALLLTLAAGVATSVSAAQASASVDPNTPTPGPHTLSQQGAEFIVSDRNESLHGLKAYNDPGKHCTIGFGHKISSKSCAKVPALVAKWQKGFDEAAAWRWFAKDTADAVRCVNSGITAPISQRGFDALVSFTFNDGCNDGFPSISALINEGSTEDAVGQLLRYVYGDCKSKEKGCHKGKRLEPGLVRRRGEEAKMLLGTWVPPTPKAKTPAPRPPSGQIVTGQLVPGCGQDTTGGIDLVLQGESFVSVWGAGEVTAKNGDGSIESGSVGYDSLSVAHLMTSGCGTTTTLTAIPAQGNHFDRWESETGACAGAGTTCAVPIGPTTIPMTAYFAPTVYKLSVKNLQPDGVVGSGGGSGYIEPGISCGSQPNGPITEVYSECESQARAPQYEGDAAQLFITADNPGPGDDMYGIASVDGCDRSVATTYPVPGGAGTYVAGVQCFLDMNSDRSVTVSYRDVGPSD